VTSVGGPWRLGGWGLLLGFDDVGLLVTGADVCHYHRQSSRVAASGRYHRQSFVGWGNG
jgi:hypothetical protein